MEEIERNFYNQEEQGQAGGGNGSLGYSVPSPTDGFVQQS